jgi:ketosteroid isomerase-like protein
MRCCVVVLSCTVLLTGCQRGSDAARQKSDTPRPTDTGKQMTQISLAYETGNSKIGISSYTLISDNVDAQRRDAEAIMQVKTSFPLAVQTKDRALFEKILARDFVFRGEGEPGMLRREDYINDRTNPSGGEVLTADYENIALQLFGDIAVMTYRNIVKGTNDKGQADPPEHIAWADIYVKENGEWKIGSVHVIDYRMERADSPP